MDRISSLRIRFEKEPLGRALEAALIELKNGLAIVSTTIRQEHLIVGGVAQGGITTVIADFAGVYAAMSVIPEGHTPAVQINLSLLRPIKEGEEVRGIGQVKNKSKTSILVEVQVLGSNDKRKAYGTILFYKPKS